MGEKFEGSKFPEESPEERYRPGDYRVEISISSAEESILACFPDFDVRDIRYLDDERKGGMGHSVFLADNEYVFRFAKNEKADQTAAIEEAMLPKIKERVSVAVPDLKYHGRQKENNLRFLGYKLIPGEQMKKELLSRVGGKMHLTPAREIGRFLKELHSFDLNIAMASGVRSRDYKRHFMNELLDARQYVYPVLDARYSGKASESKQYIENSFGQYLDNDVNFNYKPVLLHGDLEYPNIIYNAETQSVAGIVDFESLHIGDPDYDLWRPYSYYGSEFTDALFKEYPHEDSERIKEKLNFFGMRRRFIVLYDPFCWAQKKILSLLPIV